MRGQATLGPPIWPCSAWGLPCPLRFRRSGALLPHPFTLTPGLSGAVCSLRHFPSRCRGRALPGMPSVVESGPSSETEASANARLLQPRLAYHLLVTLIVATGPPAKFRIPDFEFWIYQPNFGTGFCFTMPSGPSERIQPCWHSISLREEDWGVADDGQGQVGPPTQVMA